MPIVGLRQLSRETGDVIEQLEKDGEPVVVTRHGKPIAALTAVSEEQAAAFALALVPEFVASRNRASQAIAAGEGRPASDLLAEVEAEEVEEVEEAQQNLEQSGQPEEQLETAVAIEELDIPASLVEQLAEGALRDLVPNIYWTLDGRTAYQAYVDTVVRASMVSVFERVRAVNLHIIDEVADEGGGLNFAAYTTELQRVAAVEALAIPPRRSSR